MVLHGVIFSQLDQVMTENPGNEVTMQCVFWDQEMDEGFGAWSRDGCRVKGGTGDSGDIQCECNHLSSFSVLVVSVIDNDVIVTS